MDKPADPATPFCEVYQPFLDDLAMHGRKPATIDRYRYNIVRFEKWLHATERPSVLASLEQSILFGYRQYLETLPQQPRGSTRTSGASSVSPRGCSAAATSWPTRSSRRTPTTRSRGSCPSDVVILLAGCVGNRPEDLRDRAIVYLIYSSGTRADDVALPEPVSTIDLGWHRTHHWRDRLSPSCTCESCVCRGDLLVGQEPTRTTFSRWSRVDVT